MSTFDQSILKPGDVLLYSGTSWNARLIQLKTWSKYFHSGIFIGDGLCATAMAPQGVGKYPVDGDLGAPSLVLRAYTTFPLNFSDGMQWFEMVNGRPYDWIGMLGFLGTAFQNRDDSAMTCVEVTVRFLRACGFDPFANYPADGIAPGEFAKCDDFYVVYP